MSDKLDALHKKIDSTYFKIRMMKEELEFLSDERQRHFGAKLSIGMKEVVDHPALNKGLREKLGGDFVEKILKDAVEALEGVPVKEFQWRFLFKRTTDDIVDLYFEQITNYTELKELRTKGGEFSNFTVDEDEPCELIDQLIDDHRNVIKLYKELERNQKGIKW